MTSHPTTTSTAPPATSEGEAVLTYAGKQFEFPLLTGTEGETAVDLSKLRSRTGLVGLDPGFANTASCRSAITFIDGEQGILKYRGIPIEDIAERASFLETAYLLIKGKLPDRAQLEQFVSQVNRHTMLHEDIKRFYAGFPKQAHPMAICSAVVGALSAFYPALLDPDEVENDGAVNRLLAKLPTIAAYSYKHSIGQPFMYPAQRSGLHVELPAHDVRHAVRTVRGGSGREPCPGHAPDPPRRPRAELFHQHRAARRQLSLQSLRLHLGRHQRPLGSAARRRQPEGDRDARCHRRGRRHGGAVRRACEVQG